MATGQCSEGTGVERLGQGKILSRTMPGLLFEWPKDESGEVIFVSPNLEEWYKNRRTLSSSCWGCHQLSALQKLAFAEARCSPVREVRCPAQGRCPANEGLMGPEPRPLWKSNQTLALPVAWAFVVTTPQSNALCLIPCSLLPPQVSIIRSYLPAHLPSSQPAAFLGTQPVKSSHIPVTYIGKHAKIIHNINRWKEKNHGIILINIKRHFKTTSTSIKTFNEIGLNKVYLLLFESKLIH